MSMKEKITDLFDDIPVELLDEIEVQKGNGHGRKKGIYIPKWAAVLVIGLLCLFAGTAGYAAISTMRPGIRITVCGWRTCWQMEISSIFSSQWRP